MQANGSPRVLLYGHGGSGNRGCEAILRSSTAMIRSELPGAAMLVASLRADEDRAAGIDNVDYLAEGRKEVARFSPAWFRRVFLSRVARDHAAASAVPFEHVVDAARSASVCLSIGGDNYCYGPPRWLYGIDQGIRKAGGRTVLWGASVEPDALDDDMRADIQRFDLITARETITAEALAEFSSTVHLHPDPAFTLPTETLPLPAAWAGRKMLGLNVSPMVMRYERTKGGLLRAAAALIEHVMRSTDLGIALIPHVVRPEANDLEPLSALHTEFAHTGRVVLLPGNLTAPQYKGYIARCELFIGARTHATIAAYSSSVPTLVIGYSVKARGIARDLFGDESLVLPIQSLEDPRALVRSFESLRERAVELRGALGAKLPALRRESAAAARRIRQLVA